MNMMISFYGNIDFMEDQEIIDTYCPNINDYFPVLNTPTLFFDIVIIFPNFGVFK